MHVHDGGQAIVAGSVQGGGAMEKAENNPMQGKLPMHVIAAL